ncbi:MAG TPA: hypothetical protein VMG12_37590 [Polyangiaceae bacterium]|nr:hypothetical protein [Polyangiaceae bacterium]
MSSKSRLASPNVRWFTLVTLLLASGVGCHARVVVGTEPIDDPGTPPPQLPDAGRATDDEPSDAGPESDGDDDEADDQNDDESGDTDESNDDDLDEDARDQND